MNNSSRKALAISAAPKKPITDPKRKVMPDPQRKVIPDPKRKPIPDKPSQKPLIKG